MSACLPKTLALRGKHAAGGRSRQQHFEPGLVRASYDSEALASLRNACACTYALVAAAPVAMRQSAPGLRDFSWKTLKGQLLMQVQQVLPYEDGLALVAL